METCRVSNWNVREGQRTADSKVAANLGLEENPRSLCIPPLPLPIQPYRTQLIIFWLLVLNTEVTYLSVLPREQGCYLERV